MREITLEGIVRQKAGQTPKSLRRSGKVPGVYYLSGEDNIAVAVEEKSLKPLIFTSETHIVNLKLDDGAVKSCILRDIQFDAVTDRPVHFDLQGLREDRKITIEVPIVLSGGTAQGVRDGGILQNFLHRLRIACLPKDIPDHVEIDVSQMKINQFIHIKDVNIPNVTILENETNAIVGIIPPTVEKEVVAGATAEAAAEPEVIGKGKKTEEEGAEGGKTAGAEEKK